MKNTFKKLTAILLCGAMLFSIKSVRTVTADTQESSSVLTSENDRAGDGYDDSNVYLGEIMLSVCRGEDPDEAKQALIDRGFAVYDTDIYHNVAGKYYMYLGYKTTTKVNEALKDIKWQNYEDDQFDENMTPLVISSGDDGVYVASRVHYDEQNMIKYNGQFGFLSDDWLGYNYIIGLEFLWGTTAAQVFQTILYFLLVGLLIDAFLDAARGANVYSCMYYGTNENMGEPILADSLLLSESRSEDGYETVSDFKHSDPQDIRWGRSQAGFTEDDYDPLYIHFKRAENSRAVEKQPGTTQYLSELSWCESRDDMNAYRNDGWTITDEICQYYFRQNRSSHADYYYLMYRTSSDPDKAITDLRIIDSQADIRNIGNITYFAAFNEQADVGYGALYFTRASGAGAPIEASSLTIYRDKQPDKLPEGTVYARGVFSSIVGQLKGSDYHNDIYRYWVTYKGVYNNEADGKYIRDVYIAYKGSETERLNTLSAKGAQGYIDRQLDDGVYLGYSTTDKQTEAITDMIIVKTESRDVKPEARIIHNDAVYSLVENDICGGVYYIYISRDMMAGDPIVSLRLEEDPILNDGSLSVLCDGVPCRCNYRYLTMDREGQNDAPYISSIFSAPADSRENALKALVANGNGYYVDYDMNKGAPGDCVYVGYKKTASLKKAIRDVIVVYGSSSPKYELNGITYTLAPGCELNSGNDGYSLNIYYTTDERAGEPLTELGADEFCIAAQKSFSVINNQDGYPAALNAGLDGEQMYLTCKRASQDKSYITNIRISASGDWASAVNALFDNEGCRYYIDFDLNYDAGGDYICLGYDTTETAADAVTGIIASHDGSSSQNIIYNGTNYTLASDVDLNRDAEGDYIYLYYTTDPAAGAPITELAVSDTAIMNDGSYVVMQSDEFYPSDLNKNAGGSFVYLHYLRDENLYNKYIFNVHVAGGGSWQDCLSTLAAEGCNYYLDYDVNTGTGGDWVYIGYSRTDNPDKSLRGLATLSERDERSFYLKSALFELVDNVDMSNDTGGDWMFLYQTYDKNYGEPIVDIDTYNIGMDSYSSLFSKVLENRFSHLKNKGVEAFDTDLGNASKVLCKWDIVTNQNGDYSELNAGTGGHDIFLYTGRIPKSYMETEYITSLKGFDCYNACQTSALRDLRVSGASELFTTVSSGNETTFILAGEISRKKNDAIRDIIALRIPKGAGVPTDVTVENIKYHAVSGYMDESTSSSAAMDAVPINRYSEGIGVFLYYTTDEQAGKPITELEFTFVSVNAVAASGTTGYSVQYAGDYEDYENNEWKCVRYCDESKSIDTGTVFYTVSPELLPVNENGNKVFLRVKRSSLLSASVFSDSSGVVMLVVMVVFLAVLAMSTVFIVKRKRRKKQ